MRKMVWTLSLSLMILAPLGCGGKSPAPAAKDAGAAPAAATPVFEDGFEQGKPEAWQATEVGKKAETEQASAEEKQGPAEKPAE